MIRSSLFLALVLSLSPATASFATEIPPVSEQAAMAAREIEALLARSFPADAPGVAVLVARGDKVLYRGAHGRADLAAGTPLKPEDRFRIGSITKQFAAAGVLSLVEAGKVKLDDPLSKYVPGYPGGDRITVLQLLNHTSGVKSYTGIPGHMAGPIRNDLTTAQLIDVFKDHPVDFAPGAQWAYNNSGYVLVGAVIEAASGQPWHEYLRTTFFEPLGMRDTGYGHDPAVIAKQVNGYSHDGTKPVPAMLLSMTQPHAAGALVSNVDDLLRWNRALHEGRVLKSETYRQMITPVGKAAEPGASYGFGLAVDTVRGQPQLQHGGGIFGFSTQLSYVPGLDITVVVLENDDNYPGRERPGAIARRLAAIALGNPYPVPTPIAVEPAALKAAEAVYRFDPTTRTLRVVDGRLTAQRTGGARSALVPIAADEFLYEDGFNRLRLERDAQGRIAGMRFFANGEGEGVVGTRSDEPLPVEAQGITLPRETLDRLAGNYMAVDMLLKVFIDGTSLKAQLVGQPAFTLQASSPVRFAVPEVGADVEFARGDGPAASLTLRQGGQTIEFKRAP
ncbi:MAG: beta-lactamase family protein [Xanthomonadaceae bacterium]|nr:beta-lactamase family protein [Xanthomonadaceae bacterium]